MDTPDETKKPELKLVDEEVKVGSEVPTEAAEAPVSAEKPTEGTCTCPEPCDDCESPEKHSAAEEKQEEKTPAIEVDLKTLQAEVEKLMEDTEVQKFAEAIVLGTQVFLWGVHCIHETSYSKAARGTFLEAVKASMTLDGVNPRPFSAESTLENMVEFMPFFTEEVKKRAEKATTTIEDVVNSVAEAQKLSNEEGNTEAAPADAPEDTDTQEPTESKGE